MMMNWLDILIIYAACGAPFVIHQLSTTSDPTPARFPIAFMAGIAWPIVLLRVVIAALRRSHATDDALTSEILNVCNHVETTLQLNPTNARVLRSDAERFVELNSVVLSPPRYDIIQARGLFEIAGHPNTAMATRCYERKTRRILRSHADDARSCFIRTLHSVSSGDRETVQSVFDHFDSLIGELEAKSGGERYAEPERVFAAATD